MIYQNERELYKKYNLIAGVDEAGRGPLAGPLLVAAVILGEEGLRIEGLNDSKKLTEKKREQLYPKIIEKALAWSIIEISSQEVDEKNVLQATLDGMAKTIFDLKIKPDICLIDGNKLPPQIADFSIAVVKGDSTYASIAAASILAKVYRDRIMINFHEQYPHYNFIRNKGYGTKEHIDAIKRYGITPLHRLTFKPVAQKTS